MRHTAMNRQFEPRKISAKPHGSPQNNSPILRGALGSSRNFRPSRDLAICYGWLRLFQTIVSKR